jgi:Prokaryotic phospholipase A2
VSHPDSAASGLAVTVLRRIYAFLTLSTVALAGLVVAIAVGTSPAAANELPVSPGIVTNQNVRLVALSDCLRTENPTAASYATGAECPPEGFPYEPIVDMTKAGLRAMDPHTNGCSKVPDTGATFNFKDACATHDYLADLQRFRARGVSESGMDHQFLLDMKADCKGRNFIARKNCETVAYGYRAGVQEGNYATGDEIDGSN